jgi:heptosyltransferase-2
LGPYSKILIRATNWVGDAVMSLPAIRAVRDRFPDAEIAVLARPWVADLYSREGFRMIPYTAGRGWRGIAGQWGAAQVLAAERFDCAVLLQNAFEAAFIARLAGIPRRIGYDRDARGWLLTDAIPVPGRSDIPPHQRYYYLELLRRGGWLDRLPEAREIRLAGLDDARRSGREVFRAAGIAGDVVGISPGAAFGTAKRWIPERFADAATRLAREYDGSVAVFGSRDEAALCEAVVAGLRERGATAQSFAGRTTLREFIDMAAACRVFLTNDSGAMHIASAVAVPTVAVFGATDHVATGPTGELARIVRRPVECSPCLLRECPIDHRCMTAVDADTVVEAALELAPARSERNA